MNKRVLLHVCCGPCAAFPVKNLREQSFEIVGYYYNPNIHPYKEFTRRLETLVDFATRIGLELVVDKNYDLEEFLDNALHAPVSRCNYCYEMRLRQAARYARCNGFDYFSTTLLVSPYQKHDIIRAAGEQIALEEGIPFYYSDFRSGWQEGVDISKGMELYRQPYCGCVFSERDRYQKKRKADK